MPVAACFQLIDIQIDTKIHNICTRTSCSFINIPVFLYIELSRTVRSRWSLCKKKKKQSLSDIASAAFLLHIAEQTSSQKQHSNHVELSYTQLPNTLSDIDDISISISIAIAAVSVSERYALGFRTFLFFVRLLRLCSVDLDCSGLQLDKFKYCHKYNNCRVHESSISYIPAYIHTCIRICLYFCCAIFT